jgi:hypothetical protein
MRSIDIGKDLFRTVVWHGPDKSIFRMGSCAGLRPLARAGERTLRTVRRSERCKSVAGFIITLAFLLVPYQAGAAASSSCATGKTMCGARCVNLNTAPRNCGACGNVCAAGKKCSAGVCTGTSNANNNANNSANNNANSSATASCKAPKTMCGGRCLNPATAPRNCGACGVVCGAGKTCLAGVCTANNNATNNATNNANNNANSTATASCKAPKTMCGARCVNLNTAPKNCGACGNVCAAGKTCSNGVCSCMPGQIVNGVLCQ